MTTGKARPVRDTGNGAITTSLTPDVPIVLDSVRLHLSAAGGAVENFTITIDSATDAAHDVLLFSQAMAAKQDVFWQPIEPIPIVNNDVIDFYYKNSNGRTFGLEIIYRREI